MTTTAMAPITQRLGARHGDHPEGQRSEDECRAQVGLQHDQADRYAGHDPGERDVAVGGREVPFAALSEDDRQADAERYLGELRGLHGEPSGQLDPRV